MCPYKKSAFDIHYLHGPTQFKRLRNTLHFAVSQAERIAGSYMHSGQLEINWVIKPKIVLNFHSEAIARKMNWF